MQVDFVHAHGSDEAKKILATGERFAVILLDVVMEDDESGFRLVRFIREDLQERASRIIMRTGQPGNVPERELILQYDINDYRNKTELTAMTLYTAVVTAARTFQDLIRIENNSQSLTQMMQHANDLFSFRDDASVEVILQWAQEQLSRTLGETESLSLFEMGEGNRLCFTAVIIIRNLKRDSRCERECAGVRVDERMTSLGFEHGFSSISLYGN